MRDIVCDGLWTEDGQFYDVNMSAIWSHLIRECGKLVEDYNSDLILDINSIDKFIKEPYCVTETVRTYWIGLRESGVDGEEFIKCRCDREYYYRGLYKIVVDKSKDRKCTVTLEKSSPYSFRKEHNILC